MINFYLYYYNMNKLNLYYDKLFCDDFFPIEYDLNLNNDIFDDINNKYNIKKEIIYKIINLYEVKNFNKEIDEKSNFYLKIQNKFINIINITQLINFLNKFKISYNYNKFEKIFKKNIYDNIDLTKDDLLKFNNKYKILDYIFLLNKRKKYIKQININKEIIKKLIKEKKIVSNDIFELKKKKSYQYNLSNYIMLKKYKKYFQKKIFIFFYIFRKVTKINIKSFKKLNIKDINKLLNFICNDFKIVLFNYYSNNSNKLLYKIIKIKILLDKLL